MEGLVLEYTPAADLTGPATVTVSLAGEIIAAESPDLQDPDARDGFAAKVCDGRPGIDLEGLRGELLTLAAKLAGTAEFSPEASAVETRLDAALQAGPAGLFKDTELLDALARLAVQDEAAYSGLRVRLQAGKVRIRDFDRAMKRRIEEVVLAQPPELARNANGGFFESDGCICRTKLTTHAPVTIPLCNFTASIVDETVRDDGQERRVVLGIAGKLAKGRTLPRTEVSADAFQEARWIVPAWGSDAIVWPGENRALPAAIQALSQANKARRTVYVHTGWREHDGAWMYLHAGGAIGLPPGATPACVDLQAPLTRFIFPAPVTGDAAMAAVRASLGFLDLAEWRLTVPVLAAVYRASLGDVDFGVHVAGPSGVFKSEMAALAQQHYGPELDARHLPGSWSSTANSLELSAFLAKDAVLVVDDFAPTGGGADLQRLHREAERLFRAQGNQAGRARMAADGSMRQGKPPRGLILSTGEEIPRGQSLRARLFINEIGPGDIDVDKLTACQRDAAAGLYARAMACYLAWVAPSYGQIQARLPEMVAELRAQAAADGMHARTPGIVASLAVGFRFFLQFAELAGAISAPERGRLRSESWQALLAAADLQVVKQEAAEPAKNFLRLLAAVLASQRAHVAGIDGDAPEAPARWGWRKHLLNSLVEWLPQGRRIGWTDGQALYLEPDASYSEAARLAAEQNEGLTVAPVTLRRRLRERGFLASEDPARGTLLVRRKLEGGTKNVLHLLAAVVCPDESTATDNPTSAESATRHRDKPTSATRHQENAEKHGKNAANVGFVGLENTQGTGNPAEFNERETGLF
jgi:hypothetical protein